MLIFLIVIFRFSFSLKNFPSSDLKFYKCSVFSFNWKNSLISSFFRDWYLFFAGRILNLDFEWLSFTFIAWNFYLFLMLSFCTICVIWCGKLDTAIRSTWGRVCDNEKIFRSSVTKGLLSKWCWLDRRLFSLSDSSIDYRFLSRLSWRLSFEPRFFIWLIKFCLNICFRLSLNFTKKS